MSFHAKRFQGTGFEEEKKELLPQIKYECGDCSSEVILKPEDPIRCQECGYRILYKQRTKRATQYIAR